MRQEEILQVADKPRIVIRNPTYLRANYLRALYSQDEELDPSSCRALLAAIFLRAIRDAEADPRKIRERIAKYASCHVGSTERLREDLMAHYQALRWLRSPSVDPWSCKWICDRLEIEHVWSVMRSRNRKLRIRWRRKNRDGRKGR